MTSNIRYLFRFLSFRGQIRSVRHKFSYICIDMTLRNLYAKIRADLQTIYSIDEAKSIALLLLEKKYGFSRLSVMMDGDLVVQTPDLDSVMAELLAGRPIQYIIGYTEFCGLQIAVTEGVLIPRPETEELAGWIVSEHKNTPNLRILDIGTGSGCIAAAIKSYIADSKVIGWDISDQALQIAALNGVAVSHHDIIKEFDTQLADLLDVIVSNPPYVCDSEIPLMSANVLDYEPSTALFVPDNDPLRFYRAIAQFGTLNLKSGGMLYFEINEAYGPETVEMLQNADYKCVTLRKDIHGKDRMVCGKWTR